MVNKYVAPRCNFNYDSERKMRQLKPNYERLSLPEFPKHDVDAERMQVQRNDYKSCEKQYILICKNYFKPEDTISVSKEVLYLRWNEHHLRVYFETLMALLET